MFKTVEVHLTPRSLGNLTGTINAAAQKRADRVANEAALEMYDECRRIIRKELINDRPGHRRKNGMKIINSFEATVSGEGTPRVTAHLETKSGARHKAVAALEYGWDLTYIMEPREHEFLWTPDPSRGRSHQAYGSQTKRFPYVVRPPHPGYGFMRRAREHVLQRLRRR